MLPRPRRKGTVFRNPAYPPRNAPSGFAGAGATAAGLESRLDVENCARDRARSAGVKAREVDMAGDWESDIRKTAGRQTLREEKQSRVVAKSSRSGSGSGSCVSLDGDAR